MIQQLPSPPVLTKPGPKTRSYRRMPLHLYWTVSRKRWNPLSSLELFFFCHIQQICKTHKQSFVLLGSRYVWIGKRRNRTKRWWFGNLILILLVPGISSDAFVANQGELIAISTFILHMTFLEHLHHRFTSTPYLTSYKSKSCK